MGAGGGGGGGWRKHNLDDYEAWFEAAPPHVTGALASEGRSTAASKGLWRQMPEVALTYEIKRGGGDVEVFDFSPFLADPDCYGLPKEILDGGNGAFLYLGIFNKMCEKAGVERAPFVDMRRRVTMGEDGSDFDVILASDC